MKLSIKSKPSRISSPQPVPACVRETSVVTVADVRPCVVRRAPPGPLPGRHFAAVMEAGGWSCGRRRKYTPAAGDPHRSLYATRGESEASTETPDMEGIEERSTRAG